MSIMAFQLSLLCPAFKYASSFINATNPLLFINFKVCFFSLAKQLLVTKTKWNN